MGRLPTVTLKVITLGFLKCLGWYLEILASWIKVKINFGSYQILHINDLIAYAVGTKMGASALVYLAYFPLEKLALAKDLYHLVVICSGELSEEPSNSPISGRDLLGCEVYNLGTGKGTSVLEMVTAFENAFGKRPGDAEVVYASADKAEHQLIWK
ncbi:unnamed protein product [Camellia sinensis]